MTVKELKEELSKMPDEFIVFIEVLCDDEEAQRVLQIHKYDENDNFIETVVVIK